MPNENSISNRFLKIIEDYIPFITSDKNKDNFINFVVLLLAVAWIYCGVKIYFDIGKRYKVNGFIQFFALVFGIVSGPVGLLLYLLMRPNFTQEEVDFIKIEHKFYYQQAAKVLECIKCSSYVLENQKYCTECGTQNRYECQNCKALTDYNDKYCAGCGLNFKGREQELRKEFGSSNTASTKRRVDISNVDSEKKDGMFGQYGRHLKRGFVKIFDFGGNLKQTFSSQNQLDTSPLPVSNTPSMKTDYANTTPITDDQKITNKNQPKNNAKKNKKRRK